MPRSTPEFQHRAHDGVRFRIILPFGAAKACAGCREVNSHLLDVEHKECGLAQLRFVHGEAEHRRDPARCHHDFLAFLQTRSHVRHQIGRDHPGNFAGDGERGKAGTLLGPRTQCQTDAEHTYDEEKRVRLGAREGQLNKEQNTESKAEQDAVVPGETDSAVERARTKIDRYRADDTDRVQAGERLEICCGDQYR